jgi:hypothetical protein
VSAYFRETPTGEIVEAPYFLVRDLGEVPAPVWSFACNACDEEDLCVECRANAGAQAAPPRRRHRLRFWRKERSA